MLEHEKTKRQYRFPDEWVTSMAKMKRECPPMRNMSTEEAVTSCIEDVWIRLDCGIEMKPNNYSYYSKENWPPKNNPEIPLMHFDDAHNAYKYQLKP